jgi:predicted RecA/RadA family phage recombinase
MRQMAFETSGSLPARSVSLVAAGNVNSGQLVILGSDHLSASCSGG